MDGTSLEKLKGIDNIDLSQWRGCSVCVAYSSVTLTNILLHSHPSRMSSNEKMSGCPETAFGPQIPVRSGDHKEWSCCIVFN